METQTETTHISDEILIEIQARLPLRSISRFKSVCKTWKSTFESLYFRRLFVSYHQNSSCSWSLMRGEFMGKELMGFNRCETWNLPKSPSSYIPTLTNLLNGSFAMSASSNGLVLMEGADYSSFVGNPLLQEWVKIPSCPYKSVSFGFVTRVDEDGVVLSFKVIRLMNSDFNFFKVIIYSSETGIWTYKRLHCPVHISYSSPMSLNGTLYLLSQTNFIINEPRVLIAHDFYSESNICRVIPLPDHSNNNKRALSTSRGFVTYVKTLPQNVLKIWRLKNDECWQLLWEICLPFKRTNDVIGYYAPMAMHPFDSDVVYIWSQYDRHLISLNLRTQNYRVLKDASKRFDNDHDHLQDCFMNQSICEKYMDQLWGSSSVRGFGASVAVFQSVLPRWIQSVPCPPQVKMIDTTSLLSYIASMNKASFLQIFNELKNCFLGSIISLFFWVAIFFVLLSLFL